jgi:four helix bundle protein
MDKKELEERLIDFAVLIIQITEEMPNTRAGNHLAGQIIRSSTSPALNYGEAQSAESTRDFIHKMKVVLKEIRETYNNLRIIFKAKLYAEENKILLAMKENDDLISIYVASIKTAESNMKK